MSKTNTTASEIEFIQNVAAEAEAQKVNTLNETEVEAVRNTISGMSEQEQKLAAETLPIGILFERIQNEVIASRQKLDKIAAIINE